MECSHHAKDQGFYRLGEAELQEPPELHAQRVNMHSRCSCARSLDLPTGRNPAQTLVEGTGKWPQDKLVGEGIYTLALWCGLKPWRAFHSHQPHGEDDDPS